MNRNELYTIWKNMIEALEGKLKFIGIANSDSNDYEDDSLLWNYKFTEMAHQAPVKDDDFKQDLKTI